MTFDDYQKAARATAIYPVEHSITYPIMGLVGEAGELANKLKKVFRDGGGVFTESAKAALADETSDLLWYCAALATDLGISLNDIARHNLAKLASRQARGTLSGSGDTR